MDTRHLVTDLRVRLGGLPASRARGIVEAHFAFAAEPVGYEDGAVSTDTRFVCTSVVHESVLAHWSPESTRPQPTSVTLDLRREFLTVDTDGDQLNSPKAHCEIL